MRHTLTDAQATLAKRRRHPSETRMIDDQQLRELLPRLRRFALSLSRQPACADDLVQATLERALSRWGSKRADSDLRAWLFSILYRQFLDTQRRAKRHARLLALFGREDASAPSPEQHWEAHATLQAFKDKGWAYSASFANPPIAGDIIVWWRGSIGGWRAAPTRWSVMPRTAR